jgi:hypothetical protein
MLIGVAALSAWGLYRFNQILEGLSSAVPANATLLERAAAIGAEYQTAFALMYSDIFTITAFVCLFGAVLGLFIAGRKHHVDEPQVPEHEAAAIAPPAVSG